MAFGRIDNTPAAAPVAEINMIPLIDVVLVLLIIFMITAPMMTHTVKLDLPVANSQAYSPPAPPIVFSVSAQGERFWNNTPITRSQAQQQFASMAQQTNAPELHIRADKHTQYAVVAETLADASNAGLSKIGFVTTPEAQ